jgi:RNA polymerase sigma-70 factor (ECF subfamily)
LYERTLPAVYGYLVDRCGDPAVAEDLTSETFLAAVLALRRPEPIRPSIPWLVGVAQHKLVDHWRRRGRDVRLADEVAAGGEEFNDPWDVELDRLRSLRTLASLSGHHRAVLTLRYVDGLAVAEVAAAIDRSIEATEALLTRAKAAFRRAYGQGGADG